MARSTISPWVLWSGSSSGCGKPLFFQINRLGRAGLFVYLLASPETGLTGALDPGVAEGSLLAGEVDPAPGLILYRWPFDLRIQTLVDHGQRCGALLGAKRRALRCCLFYTVIRFVPPQVECSSTTRLRQGGVQITALPHIIIIPELF